MQEQKESLHSFVQRIKNREGIVFGEPWQAKETVAAVVPIQLLAPATHERAYLLAEEAKDKVDIKDNGAINRLKVSVQGQMPIFFRSGIVLEGIGTQSRAVEKSSMVQPTEADIDAKVAEVAVRCVQMSHAISMNAKFNIAAETPVGVHRALFSRSQSKVWGEVTAFSSSLSSMGSSRPRYSASARGGGARGGRRMMASSTRSSFDDPAAVNYSSVNYSSDNLIGSIRSTGYAEKINKFIREMPSLENQIGIIVFDQDGILGVEAFDHPDSWKVASAFVIQKYGEAFTKPAKTPFKIVLDKDRINESVTEFLNQLEDIEGSRDVINKTYEVSNAKSVQGEWTIFKGFMIHLILLRKEQDEPEDHLQGVLSSVAPPLAPWEPRESIAPMDTMKFASLRSAHSAHIGVRRRASPVQTFRLSQNEENYIGFVADKEYQGHKTNAIRGLLKEGLKSKGYANGQ